MSGRGSQSPSSWTHYWDCSAPVHFDVASLHKTMCGITDILASLTENSEPELTRDLQSYLSRCLKWLADACSAPLPTAPSKITSSSSSPSSSPPPAIILQTFCPAALEEVLASATDGERHDGPAKRTSSSNETRPTDSSPKAATSYDDYEDGFSDSHPIEILDLEELFARQVTAFAAFFKADINLPARPQAVPRAPLPSTTTTATTATATAQAVAFLHAPISAAEIRTYDKKKLLEFIAGQEAREKHLNNTLNYTYYTTGLAIEMLLQAQTGLYAPSLNKAYFASGLRPTAASRYHRYYQLIHAFPPLIDHSIPISKMSSPPATKLLGALPTKRDFIGAVIAKKLGMKAEALVGPSCLSEVSPTSATLMTPPALAASSTVVPHLGPPVAEPPTSAPSALSAPSSAPSVASSAPSAPPATRAVVFKYETDEETALPSIPSTPASSDRSQKKRDRSDDQNELIDSLSPPSKKVC